MVRLTGHPKGAYLLVGTEFIERFSYYGVLALLVLFMTATGAEGGLSWSQPKAIAFFGTFSALIWLSPVVGGWIADAFLGQRRAVIFGALLMAAGHACVVCAAILAPDVSTYDTIGAFETAAQASTEARQGLYSVAFAFLGGLGLIVIGNGLLKPNITVMLGQLYDRQSNSREEAFTLFYVAVSAGALVATFLVGTIGEQVSWRYGFGICAAVMLAGSAAFALLAPSFLGEVGLKPGVPAQQEGPAAEGAGAKGVLFIAAISLFAVIFWTGYMQSGGLLTVFVNDSVNRNVGGFLVPASWIPSFPSVLIVVLGFAVTGALAWFDRRGAKLDPVRRFAIGLTFGAGAFAVIALAASHATQTGQPMSVLWFLLFFLLLTTGELVLSPAGFAAVTRYAPLRLQGRVMGVWLLSVAAGSYLSGQLGAWAADDRVDALLPWISASMAFAAVLLVIVRRPILSLIASKT